MNANELADELTELIVSPTPVDDKWACELIDNAATMLRQQQAEIEALKTENQELSALCVEFNVLRKAQEK